MTQDSDVMKVVNLLKRRLVQYSYWPLCNDPVVVYSDPEFADQRTIFHVCDVETYCMRLFGPITNIVALPTGWIVNGKCEKCGTHIPDYVIYMSNIMKNRKKLKLG